jgi:peptidoglycan/xylan/chitin deacetylase (PgdA/CDA1 family)
MIAIAVGLTAALLALSSGASQAASRIGPSALGGMASVAAPLERVLPATLPAGASGLEVPILMYHMVDFSPPPAGRWSAGLTVSTAEFVEQMDYLANQGFHPVTLEDIYAAMVGKRALPSKPVAITFDDGNMDNYTVAFPILREHGFAATFFVITGFVGDKLSMTWEDLRVMQAEGMDIQSHTFDHRDLRAVDPQKLQEELSGSRDAIASHLGKVPVVLCYPGGKYDTRAIEAAKAAGYLMAVTTHPGTWLDPASRYEWPRMRVSPGIGLQSFISSLS